MLRYECGEAVWCKLHAQPRESIMFRRAFHGLIRGWNQTSVISKKSSEGQWEMFCHKSKCHTDHEAHSKLQHPPGLPLSTIGLYCMLAEDQSEENGTLLWNLCTGSTRVLWSSRYLSPTTNAATLAQPSVGNTKAGGLCIWLGVHTGSRPWIHILRLLLLNTNAATNAHAQMQLCVTSTQDHESALMCARALRPTSQVMEPRHPASCNFCTGSMLIFTLHWAGLKPRTWIDSDVVPGTIVPGWEFV